MIIKKKEFAYSKKTREQWPFTVPEVGVIAVMVSEEPKKYAFAILYNWATYALSGILVDQFKLESLEKSGIWKDDRETGAKVSLTPFFQYLEKRIQGATG